MKKNKATQQHKVTGDNTDSKKSFGERKMK